MADIQFCVFMRSATDLSREKIYAVFDMLDVDHSGLLDFDEFYLLLCILIAVRVSPAGKGISTGALLLITLAGQEREAVYISSLALCV